MSELIMVEGQACLDYIDKPIGFGSHDYTASGSIINNLYEYNNITITGDDDYHHLTGFCFVPTTLLKWKHDINKRVVGLVLGESDEGGLEVALLGNEYIGNTSEYMDFYRSAMRVTSVNTPFDYEREIAPTVGQWVLEKSSLQGGYPEYPERAVLLEDTLPDPTIPFDATLDYEPTLQYYGLTNILGSLWEFEGDPVSNTSYLISNDKDHTVVCGKIQDMVDSDYYPYLGYCCDDPLRFFSGGLYSALGLLNYYMENAVPVRLPSDYNFDLARFVGNTPDSRDVRYTNLTNIPYNIILTRSEQYAKNYLDNGTLPPDAFLYPLDWENLPRYDEPVPTGDEPDDYPDDNTPDDDERDFDPTPNEIVSYTVNQLTNYNWYWLTVPQWSAFISWFWNDIGNYSDFDDIIAKVKGLYNDVASAVIMCRYYPVNYKWITQKRIEDAPTGNIKLGMIEKAGPVQMIDQEYSLRTEDIGHIHIGQKYKSFMDMSPYSQLSLYLPWHGFIDLDMNLFNGHDVYVKALYDYLSGTIQYYIFYDNEVLVNTILCKMAMDIPITLQTKNDRDSAIFNNVSSTIGGLVGAGAGILSGNPLGMTLGVTQGVSAFNSANASAPMRLMGNVGESGAYIGCQNCFVVVRRPTIQASDGKKTNTDVDTSIDRLTTWKKNVGMLCGYGYTLSSLSGKGFTVCHSPRINFTNSAPLQSEVDEIYNYLEKGVIL